jgi:hypothetical protein
MFQLREQASPISEGVTEIRINSHVEREINRTKWNTWATEATQVATFLYDYKRVGPGPTSP